LVNTTENITASDILRNYNKNVLENGLFWISSNYEHSHDEFSLTSHSHSGLDVLTGGGTSDADSLHTHNLLTTVLEVDSLISNAFDTIDLNAYVLREGSINQLSDISSDGEAVENAVSKAHDEAHTILEHSDGEDPFTMDNYKSLVDGGTINLHSHSINDHKDLLNLQGGVKDLVAGNDEYYHLSISELNLIHSSFEADEHPNYLYLPGRDGQTISDDVEITGLLSLTTENPSQDPTIALDLNNNFIENVGSIQFDIEFDNGNNEGRLQWNVEDGTLEFGLPGGSVNMQIGQEMVIRVRNTSGSNMTNGQLVFISGATGNKPTVTLAKGDTENTSARTVAMLTEDISNNSNGYVTAFGSVRGLKTDTDADGTPLLEGDSLFLSENVAGGYTKTRPIAPNHSVYIGNVLRVHATEGVIFVKIQNGLELEELHDVLISSVQDNDLLQWNSSLLVWENNTLAEVADDRYYTQNQLGNKGNNPSVVFSGSSLIGYDNDGSGYLSTEVQSALDEIIVNITPVVNVGDSFNFPNPPDKGSTSDTIEDTQSIDDGNEMTIAEETGAPGFLIEFVFNDVEVFNSFQTHYNYTGSLSHNINVELEITPFDGTAFTTITTLDDTGTFTFINQSIVIPSQYINNGVVKLRFNHTSGGVPSHDLILDYVALVQEAAGGGVTEHGGLTGLDDADHDAIYLNIFGANAMFGSLDMGNQDIINAGNINIESYSSKLYLGDNQESSIFYDGTDLNISNNNPSQEGLIRLNDTVLLKGDMNTEGDSFNIYFNNQLALKIVEI